MRYRELGRTGIRVSEIGFGAWGIGGRTGGDTSYGDTDDALSLRAIDAALEQGITVFDTSSVYGYGHSEALIGEALAGRRERAVIATKAGFLGYDRPADYSPAVLRESLEGSLRRLRTDHVDLIQLHNAPVDLLRREPAVLETLRALVAEGKARSFGASVKSPDEAVALIAEFGVPVVQVNLNMMDMRAASGGLLALAGTHGAGIIARTPLCFGFLSGTITADTVFPTGDHRNGWSRAQILRWIEGAGILRAAAPPPPGQGMHDVALRFCLSFPAVSTVIPGILSPEEAVRNARASGFGPLDTATLERIAAVNAHHDFFMRA